MTPRVVRAYVRGLDDDFDATLHAYQGMARSEEPERLRDHLGSISCPVQLLVGDKDHGSGPPDDEVETLASLLPAFTVDTVPASGFFIQEEQPGSVAAAVEAVFAGPTC